MKLQTKFFLASGSAAILALLILSLFSYQRYTQVTYQRMDEITNSLFDNAEDESNKTLDGIRQVITSFNFYYSDGTSTAEIFRNYNNPEKIPSAYQFNQDSKAFDRLCQNMLFLNDSIYGIYVFTSSGYIFSQSTGQNGTVPGSYDFENAEWYQSTLELNGKYYVSPSDTHDMFTGNSRSVFISQYLKDVYTGRANGVLVIDCDPRMFDLSSVNSIPDMVRLSIVNDETGNVIYQNSEDTFNGKDISERSVLLNLAPLKLIMRTDYDSMFREFNVTGALLIMAGVILIVFVLIATFLISRSMVRPIEHLSRKMASQVGHPLIQSTRYLKRTDEIGTLYNEYNAMVESLNSAVKQEYQDRLIVLDAQMKSLEARINSHFLFNTLESINSMAELEDNDQIATMSLALGNMFRYALKTPSELVTVEQELEHVNDYVSIQTIRFNNRFKVIVEIEPELRKRMILKLILQPLVENALYHGLNYCTTGDTITISGSMDGSHFYIDVKDNGVGMDQDTLDKLQKSLLETASFTEMGKRTSQSIGLKNIHSRIELYYGKSYGLSVTSKEGEWTNVRITLPILTS